MPLSLEISTCWSDDVHHKPIAHVLLWHQKRVKLACGGKTKAGETDRRERQTETHKRGETLERRERDIREVRPRERDKQNKKADRG